MPGPRTDGGVDRDVVALIRTRAACVRRVATPEARDRAGRRIEKDARTTDDGGPMPARPGHLDHVDAEERRVRPCPAPRSSIRRVFATGTDLPRARAVDIDVGRVFRVGHERVRVQPRQVPGRRPPVSASVDVGDVEDADAAEPLRARTLFTPFVPESTRPRVCSTDMKSRLPCTDMSPRPPGHTTEASSRGFFGVSMS